MLQSPKRFMLMIGIVWLAAAGTPAAQSPPAPEPPPEVSFWGREPIEVTSPVRARRVLNGVWRFQPAGAAGQPSADWGYIRVPGSWASAFRGYPGVVRPGAGWPTDLRTAGRAWYEYRITAPAEWADREVVLHLDRVSTEAEVFVDGKKAGAATWPAGDVVLTGLLTPGRAAALRLLVTAKEPPPRESFVDFNIAQRQRSGLMMRGLIGDVWMECRPRGPRVDGLYIRPSVRKRQLEVDVELAGLAGAGDARFDVAAETLDGRTVRRWNETRRVGVRKEETVALQLAWPDPKLWDFRQSNLYRLRVRATGMGLNDDFAERFGFREFWIEGRNLFLNGSPFRLRPISLAGAPQNTREVIEATIRGFLNENYNLQELWPRPAEEPGSTNERELIATVADELGWPLMSGVTSMDSVLRSWDQPGVKEAWEKQFVADWKKLRNHPSVLILVSTANRFAHGDDQNPLRIGNSKTMPDAAPHYVDITRRGAEAIEIMRRYEKTRPLTHHHASYLGDIQTANMYLCLIPLQEREEWLSAWAKSGDRPWMAIEFGLPLFFTALRGRWGYFLTANTEPFYTEFEAIYLGRRAYELEAENYRRDIVEFHAGGDLYRTKNPSSGYDSTWHSHDLDPGWIELQALFIKNTWRAWRTWGVTGGMTPWAPAGPYNVWTDGPRKPLPPFEAGRLGPYIPDAPANLFEGKTSRWEENLPRREALREGNQPSLAYIGGPREAFTAKDHHFYSGAQVEKQAILINDHREPKDYHAAWKITLGTKELGGGSRSGRLGVGENAFLPFDFIVPAVTAKTTGAIHLTARIGSDQHADTFAWRAFPLLPSAKKPLLVFDPEGESSRMLSALGFALSEWDGKPAKGRVLVIGRHAFTRNAALPGPVASFAASGGRVVILGQSPERLRAAGFRVARYVTRRLWAAQPSHPVLKGLDDEDLRDWRGKGTLIPETAYVGLDSPAQPSKWGWHWGNRGSVTSAAIEKPHHSGWTPILEGEWDLAYSPLMELHYGDGLLIWCTLDGEGRQGSDPVSDLLISRTIEYAAAATPRPRASGTYYLGGESGRRLLYGVGLRFEVAREVPSAPGLLVLGEDAAPNGAALTAFIEKGGRLMALPGSAGPRLLGFRPERRRFRSSTTVPDWPEARGLSVSDFHVRTDIDADLLVGGPGQVAAGGLLGRWAKGGGVALIMQIAPDRFDLEKQPYLRHSSWRLTRTLTQLLANLGGAFEMDAVSAALALDGGTDFHGLSGIWRYRKKSLDLANQALRGEYRDYDWPLVTIPGAIPGTGPLWLRRQIHIPERWAGRSLLLSMGQAPGPVFLNGVKLERQGESYAIPPDLAKPGFPALVIETQGGARIACPEHQMRIAPAGTLQTGVRGFYVPGFREEFVFSDDPYRYFRW